MAIGKRSSERALQKVLGQGANVNAANPLEVHDPKVGSLISYEGTTTADGAADGSTLIDSVLATKPDYNGNLVIITSGAYAGQGSDIDGVTTGGTVTAHTAFDGQILRGTSFVIVALRLVPAEVAALTTLVNALLADVGDASAATLGSILGILGDPAQSFLAMIGYEGATSLANKLTAARAALIDEITALRMAELDPANIPADIDTLLTRLSDARAGYLDELDFDLQGALTAIVGYIDTEIAALMADVGDASGATLGSILGILGDPAQSFLAMIGYEGATSLANKLTAARAALLDEITALRMAELDPANIPADIDTLLTRLSAVRAGYLDELAAANIPADIDELKASKGRLLQSMDFWSLPQEEVAITNVAGDKALPSVVVAEIPAGATIVRAIAMFKFRMVEAHTYAGVNKLSGAQEIQVKESVGGAFTDAINFVDDMFTLAQDTREGGDVIIGAIDVSAVEVDGNDTYAFQWDEAVADQDGIKLNDVQCGLRIWYSV